MDLFEFKAILENMESSRTARETEKSCLNQSNKKQNQKLNNNNNNNNNIHIGIINQYVCGG